MKISFGIVVPGDSVNPFTTLYIVVLQPITYQKWYDFSLLASIIEISSTII